MKTLVIGKGGREHALMWKLAQNKGVKLFYTESNAGMEKIGEKLEVKGENLSEIAESAKNEGIDFTVVGPEKPLVEGITDEFEKKGLKIFGPSKGASKLEGSKVFAKELMRKYNIPTADFEVFSSPDKAIKFLEKKKFPLVIKADGLCGGKGAIVCKNFNEGKETIERMMIKKEFGESGEKVVIEDFLKGEEASIIGITDGEDILFLSPSQDHKQIYDGDKGPNTGGMGAYAPCILIDKETFTEIKEKIMIPTISAMRKEGKLFKGVLYAGLMITNEGPKVLEFNVRFGDPETQAILPLLKNDLLEILIASYEGGIEKLKISLEENFSVCVIVASKGYPKKYEKGKRIYGIDKAEERGCTVFHAGTKRIGEHIVTDGGRVLGVLGKGKTLKEAIRKSYEGVKEIKFSNIYYRKDIAQKGLIFQKSKI